MTYPYPFNIINEFRSGKLDKSMVIDKLFSFLLKTDDHKKKKIVIEFLLTLYRDLRDSTLEPEYIELFKKVIQNERHVYVIQHIKSIVEVMNQSFKNSILDEIITKYVLFYDISPEEVQFIIDLDSLDPTDSYFGKPTQFIPRYKKNVCHSSVKEIDSNFSSGFVIKQHHIVGMMFKKKIEKIPESIGALKKLKFLCIYTGKDIKFPESIESLTHLKDFRIYSSIPIEIPSKLKERAQEFFIQKYLQDGIHPDDALLLANLDIIGCPLANLEKSSLYKDDPEWYNRGDVDVWDYRLDGNGRVIEIYIKPWEGRSTLSFFPEEFCFFKKLELMDLWFFELEYIPDAITNLKALKSLQISNFGKKTVRVSRGTKNFLDSFPHLTLESKLFLNL